MLGKRKYHDLVGAFAHGALAALGHDSGGSAAEGCAGGWVFFGPGQLANGIDIREVWRAVGHPNLPNAYAYYVDFHISHIR